MTISKNKPSENQLHKPTSCQQIREKTLAMYMIPPVNFGKIDNDSFLSYLLRETRDIPILEKKGPEKPAFCSALSSLERGYIMTVSFRH